LDFGIPLSLLMLTVTISILVNISSETHSRYYLSSLQSDEGKEPMPDVANPVTNITPFCYIAVTIDDKAEP